MPEEKPKYMTQKEAAQRLGVSQATLRYYMRTLAIERHKFALDTHVYLAIEDFERIAALKQQAQERQRKLAEDDAA